MLEGMLVRVTKAIEALELAVKDKNEKLIEQQKTVF